MGRHIFDSGYLEEGGKIESSYSDEDLVLVMLSKKKKRRSEVHPL